MDLYCVGVWVFAFVRPLLVCANVATKNKEWLRSVFPGDQREQHPCVINPPP